MIIETIGWLSTFLVLIGYILNARGITSYAMIVWIIGDMGWITYDVFIDNFSHLVLSLVIITINVYGMIHIRSQKAK